MKKVFLRFITLALALSLLLPLLTLLPTLATQSVLIFADNFGTSDSDVDNVITGWTPTPYTDWTTDSDGDGSNCALRYFDATQGRYLRLRAGGYLQKNNINTVGLTSIHLEYTWGQDTDTSGNANDGDDGDLVVLWKLSSSVTWTTVNTHDLASNTEDDPDAHIVDLALGATAQNTSIDIRFFGDTDEEPDRAWVDNVKVSGDPGAGINITKTATETSVQAGQTIHYTYQVTNNTGAGNITGVSVTDDKCTPVYQSGDDGDNTLEDGETWIYDGSYVATLADLAAGVGTSTGATGYVTNTATASGTGPGPVSVSDVDTETVTVTAPTNPQLGQACGFDMVLALDMSGSISDSGAVGTVKTAAKGFVNAFLPGTPSLIGVVEFSDGDASVVQDLTNDVTDLENDIDGLSASGYTNWEEALLLATGLLEGGSDRNDLVHPDLIVIFTDGDPTASSAGPSTSSQPNIHLLPAVVASAAAKLSDNTGPIRIVAVGVAGATETRLITISGPNVADIPAEINEDTDVILTDFTSLADILAQLATTLCGGTVTVHKVIDVDGNLNTTGDQITTGAQVTGWTYNLSVSGGSSNPTNDTTDNAGATGAFDISISGSTATVTVTETVLPGFQLLGATCSGATTDGTYNPLSFSIEGIIISSQDIVSCTFYNAVAPASLTIEKNTIGGTGSFDFVGTGGIPANFSIDTTGTNPNSVTYNNLAPGDYTVTETVPGGWTLTSVTGATTSNGGPISLVAGESKTVTFTNSKLASLIIEKSTVGGTGSFDFTGTGGIPANFSIDTTSTNPNSVTYNNLAPGDYTVTETVPGGWTLTSVTGAVTTNGGTIVLAAGESKTVTFTNSKLASLIIEKSTVGGTGSFDFTGTGGIPANFSIDTTGTNPNSVTYNNLVPGNYTVTETVPGGWTLTSVTGAVTTNGGTIVLAAGESKMVTFTNSKLASLTIEKNTIGGTGSFDFVGTGGIPANFSIDTTGTNPNSVTYNNLVPGNYTVTETVPGGWTLTSVTGAVTTNGGTIVLAAGESKTVTFTNTRVAPASLTITKNTVGGTGSFSFSSTGGLSPANFSIDTSGTNPNSVTYNNLAPGNYTVTETVPGGWILTSVTGAATTNGGTISLAAGESKTVTFTNSKLASLTITKNTVGGTGSFSFNSTGGLTPASFSIDTTGTNPNSVTYNNLAPGNYTVTETVPGGWTLTSVTGATTTNGGTISLAAGESKTVTFTNTKITGASLTIVKNTVGGTGSFSFSSTGGLAPASFSIDTTGTNPNSVTYNNLAPGNYTVTETVPGGWTLTSVTGAATTNGGTISLAAGESKTVTFTNTKIAGASLTIVKNTVGGTGSFSFNSTGGLTPASFSIDTTGTNPNSVTYNNLTPGNYTVTETVPGGWTLTSVAGATTTNGGTITLLAGESKTVTFTNTKSGGGLGEIIILKKDKDTGNIVNASGVVFAITPNPFGGDTLYISDNSALDSNKTNGTLDLKNVPFGTYTVVEALPPQGYNIDLTVHTVIVNSSTPVVIVTSYDYSINPLALPVPGLSWWGGVSLAILLSGALTWRLRRRPLLGKY